MNKFKGISLVLALVLVGFVLPAHAGISFTIGVGNYYTPVGDYDYLPYAYRTNPGFNPGPINFNSMMGQYGTWQTMQPFGQVWQPYASNGWRPYTQGHWIYTAEYGPYWQGYEPWAWAAYHYGNWVFSAQLGWVWIPGNTFSPGNVAWSQAGDTIGWMPMPPQGYDYSRGYLSYLGPQNQFSYYDNQFGNGYANGYVNMGGPYYNPTYRNMYYNSGFTNVAANLFTFIAASAFTNDNYANYYLPPDYTQYAFQQHIVQISPRPIDRVVLERIVRQPIQPVQVEVQTIQTDRAPLKVVIPATDTAVEEIRRNANTVVRENIAPAFAAKQKTFKGDQATHRDMISKVFQQENVTPQVEKVDSDQLVQKAKTDVQQREQQRNQHALQARQKVERAVKEGKVRGPKNKPSEQGAGSQGNTERPGPPEGRPQARPESTEPGTTAGENPNETPKHNRTIENQQEKPDQNVNERDQNNPDNTGNVENQDTEQEKNSTVTNDENAKQSDQNQNEKQKNKKNNKNKKVKDKNKENNGNNNDTPPQ
jgi:hypothetical protein